MFFLYFNPLKKLNFLKYKKVVNNMNELYEHFQEIVDGRNRDIVQENANVNGLSPMGS